MWKRYFSEEQVRQLQPPTESFIIEIINYTQRNWSAFLSNNNDAQMVCFIFFIYKGFLNYLEFFLL